LSKIINLLTKEREEIKKKKRKKKEKRKTKCKNNKKYSGLRLGCCVYFKPYILRIVSN
jgi:hypothetical protein